MSDITSNLGSAGRGLRVAVQPLHDSDLTIDNGYLLRTGSRRSSGEPAILYSSEDSTLTVRSARELCGVLLYLHLEHASGATTAEECEMVAVPLVQPEEFTSDHSVWPVAPGVDVVHLPPFLGWIAATEPIMLDDPTTRWRLIEALAALTAALGRDRQVAREAIRASRVTSVDLRATTQAAVSTRVGRGVRVLYSDDEPESVTGTPTDEELDAVLGVVQMLTEQPDAGPPEAEAIDPPRGYWQYRLTLWRDIGEVPWVLLREQQHRFLRTHQTVIVCDDPITAILAFQQELANRVQSGRTHTVTRTPWDIWHTARATSRSHH